MLIDANFKNTSIPHADICIIGTGISACCLASELLKTETQFIMIEAGPLNGNSSTIIERESVGRDFGLNSTTSIEVGGTSSLWHGVLAPLDEIDFKKRSWVPNSGWPINYEDLKIFYEKAGRILRLENFNFYESEKLPPKFQNQLGCLKFNHKFLKNKIFQRPMPVVRFKKIISDKLKQSRNSHILFNACALELVQNNSRKVETLLCGSEKGEKFNIRAHKYIVCAGALETPRLLMNSSIKNNNLGKYLMDHPMGSLRQMEFRKKQKTHIYTYSEYSSNLMIKSGLTFQEQTQKQKKLLNHCFYVKNSYAKGIDENAEKVLLSLLTFRDGGLSIKDLWNVLKNPRIFFFILLYKITTKTRYADLFFVTEQIPNPGSCISLSKKLDRFGYPISKINWQLKKDDILSINRAVDIIKCHSFDGKYVEFVKETCGFDWEHVFTSAAHHLGTARMSVSPEDGVVDKNLKVFNINNLFICDGSVFPTSGNANSSLTIAALACRLADHLLNSKELNVTSARLE